MATVAPSILSADFCNVQRDIEALDEVGITYLHVDVMDGLFVPSISFGMPVISCIRSITKDVFDVHLMIEEPIRYVKEFKACGAEYLTVHYEACKELKATIEAIRKEGMHPGLAINPGTDVDVVREYLPYIDLLLIMSVNPGFGGQKYIEGSTEKLKKAVSYRDELNPDALVEVDGGVKLENFEEIKSTGVDIIVAGSAVFKGDIKENLRNFQKKL